MAHWVKMALASVGITGVKSPATNIIGGKSITILL